MLEELKPYSVCNSFSGNRWPMGEDYYYEERWKALDEKVRAAYKKYMNSGEFVVVHGQKFKKNAGGLRDELYQCLTEEACKMLQYGISASNSSFRPSRCDMKILSRPRSGRMFCGRCRIYMKSVFCMAYVEK